MFDILKKLVRRKGEHFKVHAVGDTFKFTRNGIEHTLTVREYERRVIDASCFPQDNTEYPTNYVVMSYTVTPEIPDGAMTITDCNNGDQPRVKHQDKYQPDSSVAIGIIGGADGPTSVVMGQNPQSEYHTAFSSLHFNEAEDVEWQMIFHKKRFKDYIFKFKRGNRNDF